MKVAPSMPARQRTSLNPTTTTSISEPQRPLFRQLFRSLDNTVDQYPGAKGSPCDLVSPSPVRLTPPPSPFGSKLYHRATPTSTIDTESIASFSSCSSTPNTSRTTTPRSSPSFRTTTTTTTTTVRQPRISGYASSSYQGCYPIHPSNSSSSSPNNNKSSNNYRSGYLTPPKPFPTNPKKKKPKAFSPHSYNDSSNHSRNSISNHSRNSSNHSRSTVDSNDHHSTKKSRLQKVKTELCLYYMSNETCPYGASCHYAHGEHELQTNSLLDLQKLGHIEDANTYRIKPCFSHVAMGCCSFGKRCACMHDPRVTGTVQSWLPVTETQGNNMMTDINVEGLHQKRRFGILYGDPFVNVANSPALVDAQHDNQNESYDWKDLYNTLSNISHKSRNRRKRKNLKEVHKLSIAKQMLGGTHKWMYKYRPSHTIFNELCMVLDKRAFQIHGDKATSISIAQYRPGNPNHCLVREIAFGPDGDPSVRPVALWFDIPGDKVIECTVQKQKLFRWQKHKQNQARAAADGFQMAKPSPFESCESFVMIRPIDRDAFFLVKDALKHRYDVLRAERFPSIRERKLALEELDKEYLLLGECFQNLKRHWQAWAFPIAEGRPPIDEKTPVPPADAKYNPGEATETSFHEGRKLWKSFLSTLEALENDDVDESAVTDTSNGESYLMGDFRPKKANSGRLDVFEKLARGNALNLGNRSLPHITNSENKKQGPKPKDSYLRQSERCWKSLMLQNDGNAEWDAVVDHFINASRSQKVLNIVQQ